MVKSTKSLFFLFILIMTIFVFVNSSVAQFVDVNYYADLDIKINERGETSISGITNYPNILGTFDNLTSKNAKYWVFNLSSANYSEAFFKVTFPEDVVFNYIKSSSQILIGSENNAPFIKGFIKNHSLDLVVQYHFQDDLVVENNFSFFLIFGSVLIIIGFVFLTFFKRGNRSELVISSLSPRQREIIFLLRKKDGVTQKFVEEKLGYPKASVSRNVASLEKKGLITKVSKGYSNVLFLKNNINDVDN